VGPGRFGNQTYPTSRAAEYQNERYEPLILPVLLGRLAGKIAFVAPGGFSVRPWLQRLRGAVIGRNVWISQLVYIDELHPKDVTIGDNCVIGLRTSIISHFYSGPRRPTSNGKVVIEKDVFIGPHCVILPNVRIGEGAVIRAGTVVSRSVPAHTFWGPPGAEALGVVTVPLTPQHTYEEFLAGMKLRVKRQPVDPERESK
jgi:acetyltransferase-like isoleucine patch superfamily enzyme